MSLSFEDFQNIRFIMREELDERLAPIEGRVEALENDIKEIYRILASQEQGIFAIARQTGSKLPRSFTEPQGG